MDARQGRNQTTKGIWIAKAVDIDHPCTIVMDLEGNDGSERGETPFFLIERKLKEEVQKIWNMVPKPRARKEATLDEFFNLRVTALPNYEFQKDQFKEELIELRRKCSFSIAEGGYAKDKQDAVPASALSFNMQKIWKDIRENNYLDIPSNKVLAATFQCQKIAKELLLKRLKIERQADIQSFARWVRQMKMVKTETSLSSEQLNLEYKGMLEKLRSKVVENFKEDLRLPLMRQQGFRKSVQDCAKSRLLEFNKECSVARGILVTAGGVVSGIGIATIVIDGGSTVTGGLTAMSSVIAGCGINITCIKYLNLTEEQIKEMVNQVFQSAPMDSGISDIGQDAPMDSDISDIGQQITNLIGIVVKPITEVFQSDD
ncbi:Protein ROOT HAIR DEFECTIVE 3 [Acorus calamus]|uniref:Protein ROOT HAIR DEFECTIVE 3 n=1 Tax=Acorus calamus TaxID=4465 RepID=A0AAV9D8K8_ACOCL|nr:Protein ROOT HAIR DEFECTIVE 3 [Acorus calamus]